MPPLTNRLRAYPIRQVVQPLGSIAINELVAKNFRIRMAINTIKNASREGVIAV